MVLCGNARNHREPRRIAGNALILFRLFGFFLIVFGALFHRDYVRLAVQFDAGRGIGMDGHFCFVFAALLAALLAALVTVLLAVLLAALALLAFRHWGGMLGFLFGVLDAC